MDYGRSSESNAITITPDPNSQEIWMAGLNDQALWATEEDYRIWNGRDPSPDPSSNYDARPTQSRSGSEQPPGKKPRNSPGDSAQGNGSGSKSRAIGKMFFKTKLCCKFRAGTCPYITNCNFAHGIEELRKPPPNWQEIVAAQDEGSEPREEHQIPILSSSAMSGDIQRSYKGRHCKKFYTDEGCPYGDMCTFLHDEQSKARESVAISLGPTLGGGNYGNGAAGVTLKPSNWKTRICNKWDITGYCPFGSKCHFAHGSTELHRYGGGLVDGECRDSSSAASDQKQMGTAASKAASDNLITAGASVPHTDIYHIGAPSQRAVGGNQRQSQRPLQRWKGPDKISRIYGDWINDVE